MLLSDDQQAAHDELRYGTGNVWLTGPAGTGKSTLLRAALGDQPGVLVVAPTGIAALNADGETIHRAFGVNPDLDRQMSARGPVRAKLVRASTVVIDEVSMVRVDLLAAMDDRLRECCDPSLPFGGKRIVAVGDFTQLPPVMARDRATALVRKTWKTKTGFPFYHDLWSTFKCLELTTQHRQTESQALFLRLLGGMRQGKSNQAAANWLNRNLTEGPAPRNVIRLTNTRRMRDELNQALAPRGGRTFIGTAEAKGVCASWRVNQRPAPLNLKLRVNTRVMCVANTESEGGVPLVNGDLGTITDVFDDAIEVAFDRPSAGTLWVQKHTWRKLHPYETEWREVEGEDVEQPKTLGSYQQLPFIKAHAITVHKSQGLTFDAAEIHVAGTAPMGLMYVALSRVRTLGGIWRGKGTQFCAADLLTYDQTKLIRHMKGD